jgi:6-phosphogluconate dehydrogenase
MSGNYDIGIVGLGVMGSQIALNLASRGVSVAGYDATPEQSRRFVSAAAGSPAVAVESIETLVGALRPPRSLLVMVPAGKPVDDVLGALGELLRPGDIAIDGGNSHFADTARRQEAWAPRGLELLGVGIRGTGGRPSWREPDGRRPQGHL